MEETEGYGKAEVTAGGVDTAELSAQTMEAEKCPAFFLSEKWSTLPANSAASISSGPGHQDFARAKRCEARHLQ